MKIRRLCAILGFLTVVSLLIVSCGKATTTTSITGTPGETKTTTAPPKTTAVSNEPQYGGGITACLYADPSGFDETIAQPGGADTMHLTNQELMIGDWTKGPAGTGEADWSTGTIRKISLSTGGLAESWEMTEPGTTVFHIREGMKFGLNPSSEASRYVNGREITAEDIANTLNRYISTERAPLSMGDTRKAKISAPDKWSVKVTLPLANISDIDIIGDYADCDVPPELYQRYGNVNDWKLSVGTGPYMLIDYIAGSSATLVWNTNYWGTDPIGPGKGNKLPYIKDVKLLIITDGSTRLSALRTARIDMLGGVNWEDAKSLRQTTPTLLEKEFYADPFLAINMRLDKANLPYQDIRVRKALMMATDFSAVKDTWAGGTAQIVTFPILKMKEYEAAYCSLEEASAEAQEMYRYDVDKAKSLLADAGYPNGFKCTIICTTATVDYLSIVKSMWSKINVDMTLQQKEGAVYGGIYWMRAYDDMIIGGPGPIGNLYIAYAAVSGAFGANMGYVDDAVAKKAKDDMMAVALTDTAKADQIHKEFMKYVLDQAWAIPGVAAPAYNMWHPWVKNYHGEASLGYTSSWNYLKYLWIDQSMKKEMTGR